MQKPHSIPLDHWVEPADAFRALYAGERYAFWLDSGVDATSGISYMGAASNGDGKPLVVTANVSAGTVTVTNAGTNPGPAQVHDETIFDYLRRHTGARDEAAEGHGMGPEFRLGWVGWFGYGLTAQTSGVGVEADAREPSLRQPRSQRGTELGSSPSQSAVPDAAWMFVDRMLRFDHHARTVTLLTLEQPTAIRDETVDRLRAYAARGMLGGSAPAGHDGMPSNVTAASGVEPQWRHSDAEYLDLIAECKAAITRGDAYQLCLTNELTLPGSFDPVEVYLRLRSTSVTHHSGLLRFADLSLVSSSPEQFLAVSASGVVQTKPIKGTRPRGRSPADDARLRDELLGSPKERAENLMIVDLMRNDLGRVAEPASVAVPSLLTVESYSQVHQLVSTVRARLRPETSALDVVFAAFPAGSMTGAPKVSAMRILQRLEGGPRGAYAGAFGYIGLDGQLDLAMTIRSIMIRPQAATIGSGGGITSGSDPREELAEVKLKARALIEVLGDPAPAPIERRHMAAH